MNYSPLASKRNTILQRIAGGDAAAVEECVKTYGKLVRALAKRYTTRNEDVEDAAQEIFLEIWQKASRYDQTKSAETTFITMLAYRRLIDRLRRNYAQPRFSSIEEIYETAPNDFERQMNVGIEAKKAFAAMKSLRREQRDLIAMTVFEGMSHGEIAVRTGLPLGTVKTHVRRGLSKLRETMNLTARLAPAARTGGFLPA